MNQASYITTTTSKSQTKGHIVELISFQAIHRYTHNTGTRLPQFIRFGRQCPVQTLKKLTKICFGHYNRNTPNFAQKLCNALKSNNATVEYLELTNCYFGQSGAESLGEQQIQLTSELHELS